MFLIAQFLSVPLTVRISTEFSSFELLITVKSLIGANDSYSSTISMKGRFVSFSFGVSNTLINCEFAFELPTNK